MTKPALLYIPAAKVVEWVRAWNLHITDFDSGVSIPWEPTAVQVACWQAREDHQRLFVAKPRRAYVSTAFDLDDALFAAINDGDGQRVRVGVALDTDDHVAERVFQMASFLTQMQIPHRQIEGLIELGVSGSQIVVFTAGGKRAGASTGFQRVRYSEAAYYGPGEIGTISAAAGKQAGEIIETTIGTHASNFVEARARWRETGAWRPFHPLFFPFESHLEYRAPADIITDQEWDWAQADGFTIREAAAYWLREILPKFGGDMQRARGEYPQRPEHMFDTALGRWVTKTPKVLQPVDVMHVTGPYGAELHALIYVPPRLTSGDLLGGIDTATGKGRDRSVITIVDRHSRRLCAIFCSDRALGDDVATVAKRLWETYSSPGRMGVTGRPKYYVEDNTTGQIVIQPMNRMGVPCETFDTDEASRYQFLAASKIAVETGYLEGPKELAEECDELHRDEHGRWIGRKDILMAYGFAAVRIAKAPPVAGPPVDKRHERRIDVEATIARYARRERMRRSGM